ncbi:MAG TPA: hypothetical protein VES66_04790 [Terriglobales bacterium]|nr:hypothetical protein [Terriglobales bacterium]
MVPYRYDPEHIAPANNAPRCQHIKLNGQRCAAPALRGESHCHFHNHIQSPAVYAEPFLPFIEDATSLQFVLMRVMRMLQMGHVEYKRCALLLYLLQIACSNLKAFMAEQPKPDLSEGEQPQPKRAGSEKEKHGDGPSLAELPLGLLAKPEGGPEVERPRIRSREDYYAAVEQRQHSSAALPGESVAP